MTALEELAKAIHVEMILDATGLPGGVFGVNPIAFDGLRMLAEAWCRANGRPFLSAEIERPNFIWRGIPVVAETPDEERARWQRLYDVARRAAPLYDEEHCPGHVASEGNAKVCARCGVHVDSFRPEPDEDAP